jgi:SPP1 gp7 family putative phage head morphogenesis protein
MTTLARRQGLLRELQARHAMHHAVHGKKPKMRKRLPRQAEPKQQRLRYFKILRERVLVPMLALVQRRLVPKLPELVREASKARLDSWRADAISDDPDVNDILDELADSFSADLSNGQIATMVRPIAADVEQFNADQLGRQVEAGLGVNVTKSEPFLQPLVDQFTKENVALIKSIGSEFFSDLEKRLSGAIADGQRPEEIQTMIQERYGVSESRAALIARDQVGKFYGNLNEQRQKNLGVTGYTWRTSQDNRVREEHAMREGEHFEWDDPPEDGHPGESINCRCWAEPDLQAVLDNLDTAPVRFGDDE